MGGQVAFLGLDEHRAVGGTTSGSRRGSSPAAASRRMPSGSSLEYHRYGTWLRARNSRICEDRADQRCPTTFVVSTATPSVARHDSSRSSTTGYSFSSGGSHGLSR